ncbi:unnamed protein product [Somion occarium]|uniref:Uncharacterized protein n=1 Tax=Somion occarium TaxID=3059160 RepID=A0ABP1CPL8_9APHY
MPTTHDTLSDAAPSVTRNLNRLSLILQRASSPKPKASKSQRSATASNKNYKLHRKNDASLASIFSVAPDIHHSYAAGSSVSIADTLLSNPHESLLPLSPTRSTTHTENSPSLPPSPGIPVPPTTNDLTATDKMKLLKKVRKLSRVLGEFPMTMIADDRPSPDIIVFNQALSAKGSPGLPSSLASPRATPKSTASREKALRRSITIGHTAGEYKSSDTDVHRAKSFVSLRPALTIPSSPSTSNGSPVSPLLFASPNSGDDAQSRVAAVPNDAQNTGLLNSHADGMPLPDSTAASESGQHGADISLSPSRRSSISSSSVSTPPTAEQVQRARVAKLSRQLGDSVPPDILLRAASPPLLVSSSSPTSVPLPPSPPSTSSLAGQPVIPEDTPRRSSSLHRKKAPKTAETKKRLSLDLRALKASVVPPQSSPNVSRPSTSSGVQGSGRPLRKSRSMWVRTRRILMDNDSEVTPQNTDPTFSPVRESFDTSASSSSRGPLSEKHRLLNVRRAKKMAQVFGDKPPTALFQIMSLNSDDPENNNSATDLRRRRDSLATIISISSSISTSLSNNQNLRPDTLRVRDSYISIASIVTTSSVSGEGVITTGPIVVVASDNFPSPSQIPLPGDSSEAQEHQASPRKDDLSNNPNLTPANSTPRRRSPSPRPSTAPATSTLSSRTSTMPSSKVSHRPPSPRTPPPFSDVFIPPPPSGGYSQYHSNVSRASVDAETTLTPAEFHARQKRAAKLSKFFGVGLNDLADVLPANMSTSLPRGMSEDKGNRGRSSSAVPPQSPPSSPVQTSPSMDWTPMQPMVSSRVEVATAKGSRLRFFGLGEDVKEMDMNDAIEKLRRMKSV